jgi:hypothetical protein
MTSSDEWIFYRQHTADLSRNPCSTQDGPKISWWGMRRKDCALAGCLGKGEPYFRDRQEVQDYWRALELFHHAEQFELRADPVEEKSNKDS